MSNYSHNLVSVSSLSLSLTQINSGKILVFVSSRDSPIGFLFS